MPSKKQKTYIGIIRNQCLCCPCCGECSCEDDGEFYYDRQDFQNNEIDAINWVAGQLKNIEHGSLEGYVQKLGPYGGDLGRMYIETGQERDSYRK